MSGRGEGAWGRRSRARRWRAMLCAAVAGGVVRKDLSDRHVQSAATEKR